MTDIVYTDKTWVEQGFVPEYSLDLAYGNDENDFELTVPIDFTLERDALIYADGTGWGGIVRSNNPSTKGKEKLNAIKGATWQGILAESFLVTDSDEDHVRVSGDANAAMRSVLARQGLDRMFAVSKEQSGFTVAYAFDRFTDLYTGFRKMLSRVGAKLVITKNPGEKPTLSAVEVMNYVDMESSGRYAYEITDDVPFNHLIAVGKGEMEERDVVHLYADEGGNVSETQSIFFPRERQYMYELSSADHDELVSQSREKLEELQHVKTCELILPDGESFEVGDIVGVVDEDAGVSIASDVSKVIVRTGEDGELVISNEIGEITQVSSGSAGNNYTSSGIVYKAGDGIRISSAVISADVTLDDLSKKADVTHGHDWGAIGGKPLSFPPSAHNHDERYYTEAEVNTKLSGKSDASHSHAWSGITDKPGTYPPSTHGHTWGEVSGKPTSYPPSTHNHDDRYFTEAEINTKLAGKSDTTHSHAWDVITNKPASFSPSAHNHDDRYYTEAEMNTKLSGKSDTSHVHSWGVIADKPVSFPPSMHNHVWADVTGKPTSFPPSSHEHAWNAITGKPATFAPSAHNHDASNITSGTLPLVRGGFGGGTRQAACDNIATVSLAEKRVIGANADVNAYKIPGSYTCNSDTNARTLINCPTGGVSFHLIVDQVLGGTNYLTQTIRTYSSNTVWMRVSTNAGSTWNEWQKLWGIASSAANARTELGAAASNHSHGVATASAAGFMSAADKASFDTLKNGAVIGVKGNAEGAYRSGNVNLTPTNIGAMGAQNANGYQGMTRPDGNNADWIRTTQNGIIPYQSGGASALGTSSWPFNQIWGNLLFLGGTQMTDMVVAQGTSGAWHYIKFNSGLAICGGTWAHQYDAPRAWGSIFYNGWVKAGYTYPFRFVSIPSAHIDIESPNGSMWFGKMTNGTVSNAPQAYILAGVSQGQINVRVNAFAIGRWK